MPRCKMCKKRLGLHVEPCKCKLMICSRCQRDHYRLCSFDHAKVHKDHLTRTLLQVSSTTLDKI